MKRPLIHEPGATEGRVSLPFDAKAFDARGAVYGRSSTIAARTPSSHSTQRLPTVIRNVLAALIPARPDFGGAAGNGWTGEVLATHWK
jgi:hypothetical protein